MLINELPFVMIRCLVATIVIELLVAVILGIKNKKDLLNVILVNTLTNPIVASIPVYFNIKYGILQRNISLGILEIVAVISEGYIYKKVFVYKKINPFIVSIILNISSYFIGEIINYFF